MTNRWLLLVLVLATRVVVAGDIEAARTELLALAPIVRLPVTTKLLEDPANSEFPNAAQYLSAATFRLLVREPMKGRFVPVLGNAAVFGGVRMIPDDHGMTEAELFDETSGPTVRLPCPGKLRCFLQYAGGYYWLTTFDAQGTSQDAALVAVERTKFGATGIERSVRVQSSFNAFASRSTGAIQGAALPDSALDFDRNGLFCSTLYARDATPSPTLTYRISQVLPSGKIDKVYEADVPYGDTEAHCRLPRDRYELATGRAR